MVCAEKLDAATLLMNLIAFVIASMLLSNNVLTYMRSAINVDLLDTNDSQLKNLANVNIFDFT